jgi:hypothetical protein
MQTCKRLLLCPNTRNLATGLYRVKRGGESHTSLCFLIRISNSRRFVAPERVTGNREASNLAGTSVKSHRLRLPTKGRSGQAGSQSLCPITDILFSTSAALTKAHELRPRRMQRQALPRKSFVLKERPAVPQKTTGSSTSRPRPPASTARCGFPRQPCASAARRTT